MTRNTKRNCGRIGRFARSSGFTLIELMIVLGVIGLIIAFALPRMSKASSRAKMTDAIAGLAQLAAQVEAKCAVGALPVQGNMQGFLTTTPNGYNAPIYGATPACTSYTIIFAPVVAGSLPTLCVNRNVSAIFQYGANVTGSVFTPDDIPANIIAAVVCS